MDFLNDQETAAVQLFYQSSVMREAVRKVLLAGAYENGTLQAGKEANATTNFALSLVAQGETISNEQLGADLRASWEGIRLVENAFNKMGEIKKVEPEKKKPNQAR